MELRLQEAKNTLRGKKEKGSEGGTGKGGHGADMRERGEGEKRDGYPEDNAGSADVDVASLSRERALGSAIRGAKYDVYT